MLLKGGKMYILVKSMKEEVVLGSYFMTMNAQEYISQ